MNTEYERFVAGRIFLEPNSSRERTILGALGLAGEAGEVVDLIKKGVMHGKGFDREQIILEMGDVCWYLTLLMREFNVTLDEVLEANIEKLTARDDGHYKPDA